MSTTLVANSTIATHAFLLGPPPPPRHKRTQVEPSATSTQRRNRSCTITQARQSPRSRSSLQGHPSPRQRSRTITDAPWHTPRNPNTPRTPFTPRESFLNILDTPSPNALPARTFNHAKTPDYPVTPKAPLAPGLGLGFGYSIAFESHYSDSSAPTSRSASPEQSAFVAVPTKRTFVKKLAIGRSKSTSNFGVKSIAVPDMAIRSTTKPPTSGPQKQRTGVLGINLSRTSSHHGSITENSSTHSSTSSQKRYPLPLPYSAIVEMDRVLGDTRSSSGVHPYGTSGKTAPIGGHMPYIGQDGRLWRDRDEEFEYAVLLKGDVLSNVRRGSSSSLTSDSEEEPTASKWKLFGGNSRADQPAKKTRAGSRRGSLAPMAPVSPYDFDSADRDYHPMQHATVPPTHHRRVKPSSSHLPVPAVVADFTVPPSPQHHAAPTRERRRPPPLDLSASNPTHIAPPPQPPLRVRPTRTHENVPYQHHPATIPRAKDDFLASSFDPAPSVPISPPSVPSSYRTRPYVVTAAPPSSSLKHAASSTRPPTINGAKQQQRSVAKKSSGGFLSSMFRKHKA